MIVLWLWGGPSHMETFDLKPDAPAKYQGEFKPIRKKVPGIEISEHLPRLARLADKYVLVWSLSRGSNGHVNSTHTLLTDYPGEVVETPPFRPKYPDCAVATNVLGPRDPGPPPFVSLPSQRYQGAAFLGSAASTRSTLGPTRTRTGSLSRRFGLPVPSARAFGSG
jgi:hypothetical protein